MNGLGNVTIDYRKGVESGEAMIQGMLWNMPLANALIYTQKLLNTLKTDSDFSIGQRHAFADFLHRHDPATKLPPG